MGCQTTMIPSLGADGPARTGLRNAEGSFQPLPNEIHSRRGESADILNDLIGPHLGKGVTPYVSGQSLASRYLNYGRKVFVLLRGGDPYRQHVIQRSVSMIIGYYEPIFRLGGPELCEVNAPSDKGH